MSGKERVEFKLIRHGDSTIRYMYLIKEKQKKLKVTQERTILAEMSLFSYLP